MIMRKLLFIVLSFLTVAVSAEDATNRIWRPHEVRVGWGDPMFETMVWHNSPTYFTLENTYNYRYTGHIFAEYHYRQNSWFSYGGQVDYQQVFWTREMLKDGEFVYLPCHFYDISLMPTIRFTYFSSEWVNLFSGLGAGLLINGGTEKDFMGRKVALAPVVDLSILGMSIGRDMFFGTVEIGGMISLMNTNTIYMVGSRIVSASFGVRF